MVIMCLTHCMVAFPCCLLWWPRKKHLELLEYVQLSDLYALYVQSVFNSGTNPDSLSE